jgi:hypothetical protein
MKPKARFASFMLSIFLFGNFVGAQERRQGGRPPVRKHTITEREDLNLIPADDKLPYKQEANFKKSKTERLVESNAIPEHKVGTFPSGRNPNKITEQAFKFSLPLNPKPAKGTNPTSQ